MPKTQIVSYSELAAARSCLYKHDLAYKQRWVEPTISPALERGTAMHQIWEVHFNGLKNQRPWPEVQREIAQMLCLPDGGQTEQQELLTWIYTGYLEAYGTDPNWQVLAVEFRDEVWLPTDKGGRSHFKLKIKIDLIVRDRRTGFVWVVDWKTAKDLPKQKDLDIDDQFGLYEWAMGQRGHKIFGTVHDVARSHRNKDQKAHFQPLEERFLRSRMSRTPEELDAIAVDAYRTAKVAYAQREGEAPRSPNPQTCKWSCSYLTPCLLARKGVDVHLTLENSGFRVDRSRH